MNWKELPADVLTLSLLSYKKRRTHADENFKCMTARRTGDQVISTDNFHTRQLWMKGKPANQPGSKQLERVNSRIQPVSPPSSNNKSNDLSSCPATTSTASQQYHPENYCNRIDRKDSMISLHSTRSINWKPRSSWRKECAASSGFAAIEGGECEEMANGEGEEGKERARARAACWERP